MISNKYRNKINSLIHEFITSCFASKAYFYLYLKIMNKLKKDASQSSCHLLLFLTNVFHIKKKNLYIMKSVKNGNKPGNKLQLQIQRLLPKGSSSWEGFVC